MSNDSTSSLDRVKEFLDQRQVPYEVVAHQETFTAGSEARAAGVAPQDTAKAIVLTDAAEGGEMLLAVIPASERLDIHKVRDRAGRPDLRLASEDEIGRRFPDYEVGALPPLAPLLGVSEVVDPRTLEHDRVLCPAGDHRHSLLVDPGGALRTPETSVHDIVED